MPENEQIQSAEELSERAVQVGQAINCPQCGGVVAQNSGSDYQQCEFCKSLIFSNSVPLSVDRITSLGTPIQAACPCCECSLTTGTIENHPALYCEKCYGVLMKNQHFGSVLSERRSKRMGVGEGIPRPIDMKQYERQLFCPGCASRMEVHPYYGPGNVVIDSCGNCGYLWLDHGELTRLERAGGRDVSQISTGLATNSMIPGSMVASSTVSYEPSSVFEPDHEDHPLRFLADLLF